MLRYNDEKNLLDVGKSLLYNICLRNINDEQTTNRKTLEASFDRTIEVDEF